MKDIKEIENRIENLRKSLDDVKGTETEVYTRIVGYYRAVKNWNLGKKEEYKIRKTFAPKQPEKKDSKKPITAGL